VLFSLLPYGCLSLIFSLSNLILILQLRFWCPEYMPKGNLQECRIISDLVHPAFFLTFLSTTTLSPLRDSPLVLSLFFWFTTQSTPSWLQKVICSQIKDFVYSYHVWVFSWGTKRSSLLLNGRIWICMLDWLYPLDIVRHICFLFKIWHCGEK
jgi:hypothetical protein